VLEQAIVLALVLSVAILREFEVMARLQAEIQDIVDPTDATGAKMSSEALAGLSLASRDDLLPAKRACARHPSAKPLAAVASDASVLPTFPHLQEVKMVLDCRDEQPAVLQVHLKYSKGNLRENQFDPHMPNLRRFVKPTDWPNIQEDVLEYAQRSSRESGARKRLPDFGLRMFDHSGKYMQVRHAEISACPLEARNGRSHKVWLHLKDFVHCERTVPLTSLATISEQPRACTEYLGSIIQF